MSTSSMIDSLLDTGERLPELAGSALRWASANAWWIAALAAVALAVRLAVRALLGRGSLQDRGALEVIPTNSFDPSLEDVLRFLQRLAQAQRSTSRWTTGPHRGSALRIRLTSDGGPLSLRLEGQTRALSVLRNHGFSECELRPLVRGGTAAEQPTPQIEFKGIPRTRPA